MYASNQQNDKIEIGLEIHIFSLSFLKNTINDLDFIRMSITSKPDRRKKYFYFNGKQFLNSDLICSFNITNETKEIDIVFRKKNFIEGHPIIGSTVINSNNLPKIPQNINQLSIGKKSTDIQIIKISEEIQMQFNKINHSKKAIGEMKVQISVVPPYPDSVRHVEKDNNAIMQFINLMVNDEILKEPKYNSYIEYILC